MLVDGFCLIICLVIRLKLIASNNISLLVRTIVFIESKSGLEWFYVSALLREGSKIVVAELGEIFVQVQATFLLLCKLERRCIIVEFYGLGLWHKSRSVGRYKLFSLID